MTIWPDLSKLKAKGEELKIPLVDMALVTILFACLGLLGGVFIVAGSAAALGWGSAVLLLWQMALFSAMACVGFLFGHPRVARGVPEFAPERVVGSSEGQQNRTVKLLDPSTSLQDITDWLTKMIVGVSLVQLKQIPDYVDRLARTMAWSVATAVALPGDAMSAVAGLCVGIIVTSSGCGFVYGYLMTRLYLQRAIQRADEDLSPKYVQELKERISVSQEMKIGPETITDLFSTKESEWDSDPNKGKFGGKSEANDRRFRAIITPLVGEDSPVSDVTFEVTSSDPMKPLVKPVVFHLHPTFNAATKTVTPVEGAARLNVVAWGAFTAGAVGDDGQTRLELDLVDVKGGTPRFYAQ